MLDFDKRRFSIQVGRVRKNHGDFFDLSTVDKSEKIVVYCQQMKKSGKNYVKGSYNLK